MVVKTLFVINDSKLIEGVNSFYSRNLNGYTSDISKATQYENYVTAMADCVSGDEDIVEVEVSYTIKDQITPIGVENID